MDEPLDQPKRVTPTEARAKLLRSLITLAKPADRDQQAEAHATFVRALLHTDEFSSGK